MKNVFIVGKENIALKMNDEQKFFVVEGQDTVESLLLVIKDSLEKIQKNDNISEDATTIFLPGFVKALATGSVMNYIRNAKTGGDKDITPSNVALYKEVMAMYGERCFNVHFRDAQYFGKSEVETSMKKLNDKAWEIIKSQAKDRAINGTKTSAPVAPAVNPKALSKIAELEDQLVDAICDCDEELEAKLTAQIEKLKVKFGMIVGQAPVVEEPNQETVVEDTKEDSEEIDWSTIEEEC